MLNFNDALSVNASTNGSDAGTPDGKLTYPLPSSSTGTDSASDTATETGTVTSTDDPNTLRVGPGQPFDSLSDAVAASQPGDTILLEVGIYESDYTIFN